MFDLSGKVALVTGAGRGVGAGIARTLARQGAAVAVNDLHAERAEATVAELEAAGGRAAPFAFDVTDYDSVCGAVETVEQRLGPLAILVNNAGVPAAMRLQAFRESQPADWRAYVDLNLYGVLNCCRAVIDGLRERRWGRIVTISSAAGTTGLALGISAYAAGKSGALGFMRHLALENADAGVTANSIALGLIGSQDDPASTAALARTVPVGRPGTAEDVGALCAYLVSDESAWLTGQTLALNGGSTTS